MGIAFNIGHCQIEMKITMGLLFLSDFVPFYQVWVESENSRLGRG